MSPSQNQLPTDSAGVGPQAARGVCRPTQTRRPVAGRISRGPWARAALAAEARVPVPGCGRARSNQARRRNLRPCQCDQTSDTDYACPADCQSLNGRLGSRRNIPGPWPEITVKPENYGKSRKLRIIPEIAGNHGITKNPGNYGKFRTRLPRPGSPTPSRRGAAPPRSRSRVRRAGPDRRAGPAGRAGGPVQWAGPACRAGGPGRRAGPEGQYGGPGRRAGGPSRPAPARARARSGPPQPP
jgi:hypothetical protein